MSDGKGAAAGTHVGASDHAHDDLPRLPSLDAIYREHHGFVWRCVVRMGVAAEAVDDVVQDVFLVVARRMQQFEGRSGLRTWIFGIARHVVQHHFRSRGRRERKHAALHGHIEHTRPTDERERHEAARTLHRMLAELDEDKRIVFMLSELEQMTAPEIAAAVGAPVPTVYSRLRAAKLQMQRVVKRMRAQSEAVQPRGSRSP